MYKFKIEIILMCTAVVMLVVIAKICQTQLANPIIELWQNLESALINSY